MAVGFDYDLLGRRNRRWDSTITTTYVYDGPHIIAEYTNGSLTKKYIYGPGVDNPVAMINVSGTTQTWYYYYADALGSIRLLTDASGVIRESYTYDPHGLPRVMRTRGTDGNWLTEDVYTQDFSSPYLRNPILFTGRWWDSTTQLYHYRAREYSPLLGRFLQPDPIGYADSMNLYQYCGNNPVNWIDPWGLDVWVTPGLHNSIVIGDPKGYMEAYSFGVMSYWGVFAGPWRQGEVYMDMPSTNYYNAYYLKTTPEQDAEMIREMRDLDGSRAGYDFWTSNCRTFCRQMFNAFKERYGNGKKS